MPIDWFKSFRLVRLHHGEEKFYNLSVLCQFSCPPPLSPSPLLLPPLPLPSSLPGTVVAIAIILFVAVAIAVARLPPLLPLQSPSSSLLQSTRNPCRHRHRLIALALFVTRHPHCRRPLQPLPFPSLSSASLIAVAIAIAIAIARHP